MVYLLVQRTYKPDLGRQLDALQHLLLGALDEPRPGAYQGNDKEKAPPSLAAGEGAVKKEETFDVGNLRTSITV